MVQGTHAGRARLIGKHVCGASHSCCLLNAISCWCNSAGMDALVQEQERTCLVAWRALGAGCPAPEAGKLLDAGLSPAALVEAVEGLWWVRTSACLFAVKQTIGTERGTVSAAFAIELDSFDVTNAFPTDSDEFRTVFAPKPALRGSYEHVRPIEFQNLVNLEGF